MDKIFIGCEPTDNYGVYVLEFYGYKNDLFSHCRRLGIYVGQTKGYVKDRLSQHLHTKDCTIRRFIDTHNVQFVEIRFKPCNNRIELNNLEKQFIKEVQQTYSSKLILNKILYKNY